MSWLGGNQRPHGPNPKQKPLCVDQSLPYTLRRIGSATAAVALVELVADISHISVGKIEENVRVLDNGL